MKLIIFILLCLFFNNSIADNTSQTISVTGIGKNFDEAKIAGFNTAIELVYGSAVVSEIKVQNSKIIKDNVINYSSGYILKYSINDVKSLNRLIHVSMSVTVKNSNIANRVLSSTNSNNINTVDISTQQETFDFSKNSAKKLISTVLDDYPHNAFIIKSTSIDVINIDSKNLGIANYYKLSWNKSWLDSLNEVLGNMNSNKNNNNSTFVFMVDKNKNAIFNHYKWNFHYFNDGETSFLLKKYFISNKPYVKMNMFNDTKLVYFTCMAIDKLNFFNDETSFEHLNAFKIHSFNEIEDSIGLKFPKKEKDLRSVNNIKLEITTKNKCKYNN